MDFASLKAKAQQGLKAGESELNKVKDRFNQPGSKGSAPPRPTQPKPAFSSRPAPAVAASTSQSFAAAPPPVSRAPPPNAPARSNNVTSSFNTSSATTLNWSQVLNNPAEKEAFFGLLDEYFATRQPQFGQSGQEYGYNNSAAPPPPQVSARPTSTLYDQNHNQGSLTSYPPPSQTGSHASDCCQDFLQDTTAWHTASTPQPRFLQTRNDYSYVGSMMQIGNKKTLLGAVLFCDLSLAIYNISFQVHSPAQADRQAYFSGLPANLSQSDMINAYETYSEVIAQFAEQAEASRRPVGNGECWTLAHEAIKACDEYDVACPVQSINRTHGHLIYEAKVISGQQTGRWKGEDDRIRRGDIVEWRTVKIREVNAPKGSWMTLGAPEHTAVVISESVSSEQLRDGVAVEPSSFSPLEVIEQSAGQLPTRRRYDLSAFEEGQMWVYRPVSMELYVGQLLDASWPPSSRRMQRA